MWYILLIGLVGVGALIIGVVVARYFRKRLREDISVEAFTLQDLRELRAGGVITQREFETMRAAIIAKVATASRPTERQNGPDTAEIEENDGNFAGEDPPGNDPDR